jgi:hypothetical protein
LGTVLGEGSDDEYEVVLRRSEMTTSQMYVYESPEGERVEATAHQFAIQLKGLGYTRVVEEFEVVETQSEPEQPEVNVDVENEQDENQEHSGFREALANARRRSS